MAGDEEDEAFRLRDPRPQVFEPGERAVERESFKRDGGKARVGQPVGDTVERPGPARVGLFGLGAVGKDHRQRLRPERRGGDEQQGERGDEGGKAAVGCHRVSSSGRTTGRVAAGFPARLARGARSGQAPPRGREP